MYVHKFYIYVDIFLSLIGNGVLFTHAEFFSSFTLCVYVIVINFELFDIENEKCENFVLFAINTNSSWVNRELLVALCQLPSHCDLDVYHTKKFSYNLYNISQRVYGESV